MTDFWISILNFCETAVLPIGTHLMQEFGQVSAVEKPDGSLVTRSDQWTDAELRAAIAQAFPTHGVLSEEAEHQFPAQDWCWVIDPIDGTTNFTRGVPLWGISLGLLYQGTPVFGYVHLPPIHQSFHGFWLGDSGLEGTNGAFLNGRPIHTRPDDPSGNQLFNICARSIKVLQHPFPCKIRMLGVASYNLLTVAAGVTLGGVEATPKIWDIAAVWAIVQAAGGAWVPLQPKPIFPLQVGQNYGDRPYPTLVVSRAELIPKFRPLVEFLGTSYGATPEKS
ncbi:MAG: inositol monophosphatase family protein [Timaviella obliquedivisa GSE-PSE-MK23-08B]|jgi:myo-inositol-1(or 4)-monophosphatase|nr:inositol monophosphatase family protein [Timaviella obliquedivisa GSE-PSE-MK23-08B]